MTTILLSTLPCASGGGQPCSKVSCLFASNGTAASSKKCEKDSTGWCKFKKMSDFLFDPWCMYFCEVYGEYPDKFPLSIADSLSMIYDTVAKDLDVKQPDSVGSCPGNGAKKGVHYSTNNHYQPPKTSWIWDAPPYDAEKEKKWVEVIHQKDPFGDEKQGCWMLKGKRVAALNLRCASLT